MFAATGPDVGKKEVTCVPTLGQNKLKLWGSRGGGGQGPLVGDAPGAASQPPACIGVYRNSGVYRNRKVGRKSAHFGIGNIYRWSSSGGPELRWSSSGGLAPVV